MTLKLVKQTFVWFILVGCISYATAYVISLGTGQNIADYMTFINSREVIIGEYTTTLYTLDVHAYMKQIEQTITGIPWTDMVGEPLTFPEMGANIGKNILNAVIFLANFWIMFANVAILLPTKLLLQPVILIFTVLGFDFTTTGFLKNIYDLYSLVIQPIIYV